MNCIGEFKKNSVFPIVECGGIEQIGRGVKKWFERTSRSELDASVKSYQTLHMELTIIKIAPILKKSIQQTSLKSILMRFVF